MIQLFLSHAQEDVACAVQLRRDLEAHGYGVYQSEEPSAGSSSSLRALQHGVRGSAAIVVVWSSRAAESEWVERHILLAQRLQKPIVPVTIDATPLPIILVDVEQIRSMLPCADAAAQVLAHLPSVGDDDLLNTLLAQSSHAYIRERRAAIEHAAEMLQRGEHREQVLALLEDIARNDLIQNLRDLAQSILQAEAQREQPRTRGADQSRHIFGARCPNGHVSYFNKREVCPASGLGVRSPASGLGVRSVKQRGGAEVDELSLKCTTCGFEMTVPVDCEGYK